MEIDTGGLAPLIGPLSSCGGRSPASTIPATPSGEGTGCRLCQVGERDDLEIELGVAIDGRLEALPGAGMSYPPVPTLVGSAPSRSHRESPTVLSRTGVQASSSTAA